MNAVNHVPRSSAFDSMIFSQSRETLRIDSMVSESVADIVPSATLIRRDLSQLVAWLFELGFDSPMFLEFRKT